MAMPELHTLDLSEDRAAYRAHTASLLRLIRRTQQAIAGETPVFLLDTDDRLHLALWSLGAFRRNALPGGVWINQRTGWPVVRHPATLQYLTQDTTHPLGEPQVFPYPRFSYLSSEARVLSIQ